MMCESAKQLYLDSWLNTLINDFQCYGACGGDEDWAKMKAFCDPTDLLPDDPFGMNEGSVYTVSAEEIESTSDDYERSSDDPVLEIIEKMKIKYSQVSGACGRVEDCVKIDSSFDPIDLLPTDPFGMNEVSEIDSDYYWGKPVLSTSETMVNSEENFQYFGAVEETSSSGIDFSELVPNVTKDANFGTFEDMNEVLVSLSDISSSVLEVTVERCFRDSEDAEVFYGDVNCLHEGLLLSLGYLGVQDLLSVEMVCRSLRSAVQNDPLLWRFIHIDYSLGVKITDDDLYRLTQRAQGNLRCLTLDQCSNITFYGLKRVLDNNPMLKKLNVPRYIPHTPNELKTSEISKMPGINSLKPVTVTPFIGSVQALAELRSFVAADKPLFTKSRKLNFFHDEKGRSKGSYHCRPCCACTERCVFCGRCIENCDYFETFLFKNVCLDCINRSSEDPEIPEEKLVDD